MTGDPEYDHPPVERGRPMNTSNEQKVAARDVRAGDRLTLANCDALTDDSQPSFIEVAVAVVEPYRISGYTRYRVRLVDGTVLRFGPRDLVPVMRAP